MLTIKRNKCSIQKTEEKRNYLNRKTPYPSMLIFSFSVPQKYSYQSQKYQNVASPKYKAQCNNDSRCRATEEYFPIQNTK